MSNRSGGVADTRRLIADIFNGRVHPLIRIDALILAAAVVFLLSQGMGYAVTVATAWATLSIIGISVNLLLGFTGLFSLAQVGFYGIGAYTVAILTALPYNHGRVVDLLPAFGMPFAWAVVIAALLCGVIAALLAGVVARFRGDVFLLVTFGFGVIMEGVFWNWIDLTRGAFGIRDIPTPAIGGWVLDEPWKFLLMELIVLAFVALFSWLVTSGSFGRVLRAIREDEDATQVFGYRTRRFKGVIWVVAAMIAGLAGGLFAGWVRFVDPNSFTFQESLVVVMTIIVGGLGTIRGALIGALAYVVVGETMRFLPFLPPDMVGYGRQALLAILLILVVLFRPEGIAGNYKL